MPTATRGYTPVGGPGSKPKPRTAPMLTRQQLELMDERQRRMAAASSESGGTNVYQRALLRKVEEKLVGAPAGTKPMAKPKAQGVPAKPTAPVAAPPELTFAPLASPDPAAAATTATTADPIVATTSPAEDAATAAANAEAERLRKLEEARVAELKRQEEARRRRGSGIMSFVTGGLRGLPSGLSQILGV